MKIENCTQYFNTGHFWYSAKMAVMLLDLWPPKRFRTYANINGERVEYTLMRSSNDPDTILPHECGWDDIVYLGYGEYAGTE